MRGVPPSSDPPPSPPCFGSVVVLRGELDLVSAPLVDRLLREATDGHPGCDLLVDLREVTFADCAGLGPLAKAAGRARRRGGTVTAMVTEPRVLKLLALTRIAEVIGVLPSLDAPRAGVLPDAVGPLPDTVGLILTPETEDAGEPGKGRETPLGSPGREIGTVQQTGAAGSGPVRGRAGRGGVALR
ncbi:STAS domain-containing protein [Peterkaempfera sp. SMS 1(5)a]|uniref:STAS domain-containing protein n=1 Tax=Peterkaempfera podocarpi TaxID=3232308 RepID=UPI00366F88D0